MKSLIQYINESSNNNFTKDDYYKGWDVKKATEDIKNKGWYLYDDNDDFVTFSEKKHKSCHNAVTLVLQKGENDKVINSYIEME